MMKIKNVKAVANRVFSVTITVTEPSQADADLLSQFGMPSIDLGGDFTDGDALSFTLPTLLVPLIGEPMTMGFDGRDTDDEDAALRATTWSTEIISRIEAAITTLRTNDDDFTSTSESTY